MSVIKHLVMDGMEESAVKQGLNNYHLPSAY